MEDVGADNTSTLISVAGLHIYRSVFEGINYF